LTGEELGEVKELLYDSRERRLLGFIITDGGWVRKAKAVLLPQVREITDTAVVVEDRSFVRDVGEIGELLTATRDVKGFILITADGRELGIIQDLVISPASGIIEGYELSDGVIDDLLKGRTTVNISGQVDIIGEQVIVTDTKGEEG
ncbi:hypothetical protein FDZ73_22480, partial [bacterium]